jgi:hypothetical protein
MHQGRIYVRLSKRLAAAFGMSYREAWNQITGGETGFTVLRVPTRHPKRKLCFLPLDEINRALGRDLYQSPSFPNSNAKEVEHVDHEETDGQA